MFWLSAMLGTAGLLAAAAAVVAAIGSVRRVSLGAGQLKFAGLALSYPRPSGSEWLLVGLAWVGASAITLAGRATFRQRSGLRSLLLSLEILDELDEHPGVTVIAGSRPEAFCAGYLRPAVYISHGALELLSPPELEAVVAHEQHHRLLRDPLRFAFGHILSQALFFVPIMRLLRDRYANLAELNADRAAVRASAGRQSPLASALLVFDASAPPGTIGISPDRVDSLLGQPPRWRLPLARIGLSIVALGAVGVLIWQASGQASVRATFNLPFLSSQPCVMMLALLLVASVELVRHLASLRQIRPRRG